MSEMRGHNFHLRFFTRGLQKCHSVRQRPLRAPPSTGLQPITEAVQSINKKEDSEDLYNTKINRNMVEWTEEERAFIKQVFSKLNYEAVGPKSLCRALVVYPWTQRYFAHFGNLYNEDAIMANPEVLRHGAVVLRGLDLALNNMDNIKSSYAELSELHSEKLHVDPDNFKLMADCITVVIATQMRSSFTPAMQAAWYKFLSVVVSALSRQYH